MDHNDVPCDDVDSCVQIRKRSSHESKVRASKNLFRWSRSDLPIMETRRYPDGSSPTGSVSPQSPKEDLSRIKSAYIGNVPPPSPPYGSADTTRKSTKWLKFMRRSVDKPKLEDAEGSSTFCGTLVDPTAAKEPLHYRVSLSAEKLKWVSETRGKHSIALRQIVSVSRTTTSYTTWPYGLEILYLLAGEQPTIIATQVLAARTEGERTTWLQRLVHASSEGSLPESLTADCSRAGPVNLREGAGGSWVTCWLVLKERELYYLVISGGSLLPADLRYARRVAYQANEGEAVVDLPDRSLYLKGPTEQETRRWATTLREAALRSGETLEQQQLTRGHVPVILDTCTTFVAAHGGSLADVYSGGSDEKVLQLLTAFHEDAWEVRPSDFAVRDVAATLLKFCARLPNPLLPSAVIAVALSNEGECEGEESRAAAYRSVLQQLPQVRLASLRCLLGHLHLMHCLQNAPEDRRKAMMDFNSSSLLAKAWAPPLLHRTTQHSEAEAGERAVLELTELFPLVFELSGAEMQRQLNVLRALQRHNKQQTTSTASSEPDRRQTSLRVWVSIGGYLAEKAAQITVGPETLAGDVCTQLQQQGFLRGETDVLLQEHVLRGALWRPLHPREPLMPVVLRWSDWDEADRRDNQLVLASCPFYLEIKSQAKPRAKTFGELRYSDSTGRHQIVCEAELDQTWLCCSRDKKSPKFAEWRVEELTWYIGNEPKRETFSKWTLTFITKGSHLNRSREHPYFGCCLSGASRKELHWWCAGLLLARFSGYL